jgi:hypothetical protein
MYQGTDFTEFWALQWFLDLFFSFYTGKCTWALTFQNFGCRSGFFDASNPILAAATRGP